MIICHHLYTKCIIYCILKRKLARKKIFKKIWRGTSFTRFLISPLGPSVPGFSSRTPQWVQARAPHAMPPPWAPEHCCSTLSPGTCCQGNPEQSRATQWVPHSEPQESANCATKNNWHPLHPGTWEGQPRRTQKMPHSGPQESRVYVTQSNLCPLHPEPRDLQPGVAQPASQSRPQES